MAIAKFTQVVSFFKTTLAQRLTDSATDVTLAAVPGGVVEYPTWAVIEPQGDNRELIYLPSAPSTLTYSTVVRGLDPESNNDTLAATFNKEHPANVEVIIAPTHRHWNELVKVMDGTVGTGANVLRIGDETDVDVTIYAQNADASKPYFQYDSATNKWLISNDGTSTFDISAGGSGLTRGPGVDVVASAITLDVRTSGGLRNNQGTGSVQADVDPTVVARLDTANTWAAVQTVSADNLQITSDPNSADDAVRKSWVDSSFSSVTPNVGDGSDGAVTISAPTTLTRDMYYTTLVVDSGITLSPANFRIFASTSITNNGTISVIGGNASGATPGTAVAAGSFTGGSAGGAGAVNNGTAGTTINSYLGGNGGTGGSVPARGNGAAGGGGTVAVTKPRTAPIAIVAIDPGSTIRLFSGGAGGGGGGGDTASISGGGGGGGGGVIFLASPTITNSVTGTISVVGGNGGTGGSIGFGAGGGGGGGGGSVITMSKTYSNLGSVVVTGGTGGSPGSGGGTAGANGGTGNLYQITL